MNIINFKKQLKKIITIIALIFLFKTSVVAEEVEKFEIEGISVSDSLLKFYNNSQIKKFLKADYTFFYKNSNYATIGIYNQTQDEIVLEKYGGLGIIINTTDKNYKILSIAGQDYSFKNYNECISNQKEISQDIKKILNIDFNEDTYSNQEYISGGVVAGKASSIDFNFNDGSTARVICYELNDDASKSANWKVKLEIVLNSKKINKFIQNR